MRARWPGIAVFVGLWTAWAVFLSALIAYSEHIPFAYAIYCNAILFSIAAVLSLPIVYVVGRSRTRKRNHLATVLAAAGICLAYSAAWVWLSYWAFVSLFGRYFLNLFDPRSGWIFLIGIIMCGVILGISYSRRYSRELHEAELQRVKLQVLAKDSELRALRSQMNPHFLFNSINSVYAMIDSDPKNARGMLVKLSDLLRLSLAEMNEQFVPFERDWDFTQRYLDIERIRFKDRLRIQPDIDSEILKELVPSLLLQPIVENAVKHGVALSRSPVTIEISARVNASRLEIAIGNTGQGTRTPSAGATDDQGHGLQNLAARLSCVYGDSHRLTVTERPGGQFRVLLSLPRYRSGGTD
jgi:two-component system LytT family sensor kinase